MPAGQVAPDAHISYNHLSDQIPRARSNGNFAHHDAGDEMKDKERGVSHRLRTVP